VVHDATYRKIEVSGYIWLLLMQKKADPWCEVRLSRSVTGTDYVHFWA
jgi:hypothetical protein